MFLLILIFVSALAQENSFGYINTVNNASSVGSNNIWLARFETTNVGRFKYQDGEVILSQNQLRPSDFFFSPFPHIEPNLTECYSNDLSGHIELALSVSLYTTNLLDSVEQYIKQHQNICRNERCEVSLLPMHSVRLFQRGLRTTDAKTRYTLDNEWHSNTQLRQTIEFIIYTSNMSVCQNLKESIVLRCRLANFEVHYLLHGQQTISRKMEITTDYITETSMYNQIRSQISQDTIALTGNDYKNLLSETMDQLTMNLRADEGYESIQDPVSIEKILDRQLKYKESQLTSMTDHLWESLYWTPELTRPDRLSKVLNQIIKQDSTDSNRFRYDSSQANEAIKQDLKLHEKEKLAQLEKYLLTDIQNNSLTTDLDRRSEFGYSVGVPEKASVSMKFDFGNRNITQNATSQSTSNDTLTDRNKELDRFNGTNNSRMNSTARTMRRN